MRDAARKMTNAGSTGKNELPLKKNQRRLLGDCNDRDCIRVVVPLGVSQERYFARSVLSRLVFWRRSISGSLPFSPDLDVRLDRIPQRTRFSERGDVEGPLSI